MTNSFQSTAFQSSASPVDTFVQPVRVQPKTGIESLAETLAAVNPNLQKFIGTKIEQEAEREAQKAVNDALDGDINDFKAATKILKSDELIGGNIFYDRAFRRSKAQILGSTLETRLKNSYKSTLINGSPLSTFDINSAEYKNWENNEINQVVDAVGNLDEDTFNRKFLPYLINAKQKINQFALSENQKLQLQNLESQAVELGNQVLTFATLDPDSDDLNKNTFLLLMNGIKGYESDINKLGLTQEQRSNLNKRLLTSIYNKATEIGYETRDAEFALELLESANLFPYGPGGKLNLTNHPDYQAFKNKLRVEIETYSAAQDNRDIQKIKNIREKQLDNDMLRFGQLLEEGNAEQANILLRNIKLNNPLRAANIGSNASALDGDTNERYAQMLFNIQNNTYGTLVDSRIAAMEWFNDPRTPPSSVNVTRLTNLLKLAGTVDTGILTPLNQYFTRFDKFSKDLLLNNKNAQAFSRILSEDLASLKGILTEEYKSDFRRWRLDNPNVGSKEFAIEDERLKTEFKNKLIRGINDLIEVDDDSNKNDSIPEGLEGVPTSKENNNQRDFFGNTSLGNEQKRLLNQLQNMGGVNKENITNLVNMIEEEKNKVTGVDLFGRKAEADRLIKFLMTGQYGFGFGESQVYEPLRNLMTEGVEPSAFSNNNTPTTVEVKQGDTLSELAKEFGVPLKALIEANNITNPNLIKPGQELIVPMVETTTSNEIKTKNKLPEVELNKLKEEIKIRVDKKQPLTKQQINQLLLNAGFTAEQAKIMTAIAMAESDNKVNAFYGGTEKDPEASYGLFQINMYNYKGMELGNDRQPKLGIDNNEALYDPVLNAIAAKLVFDETQAQKGNGYLAWGVYSKDGETEAPDARYKQFLD
mgnify:CR=1 FL=1